MDFTPPIESVNPPTYVSLESSIDGNLCFEREAIVMGKIVGHINQKSHEALHIDREAIIEGKIESKGPIIIKGNVKGEIHCMDRVILYPTSCVLGTITCMHLQMMRGAYLEGEVIRTPSTSILEPHKKNHSSTQTSL